ncbi:ATP-binding cassette subfamily C protein [Mycoplasmoides fastidiosum]|uniref:ATP-binding cassette subfamily C protein n=1 Tax=Mycoplasmoides fastidiosum TaxID=92758 RepID=A0ABU0LZM5_9BACT|nr:ABC transporter ATP-binding protein [Mycoplasmoides fastidiosum]MDQ0514160.1 ATP-binding cassette subfamily C protein [Mycoplasmoides fastidiosum]UUD37432.1 ABC transporter ATP-binding protein/permease [Mycoplasmoides fastidiosum]
MFYIKQHKTVFLFYFCLSIITSGIVIFEGYLTYLTYQYILAKEPDKYNTLIVVQAVLFFVGLVSYIIKTKIKNKTAEQIIKDLKINTIARISLVKNLEFKTNKKGFYVAQLTEKLDFFFSRRPGTLFSWVDDFNLFWISFPVLIFMDWRIGLISIAISIINMIVPLIMGRVSTKYNTSAVKEIEKFNANLLMMVDAFSSFYCFNKEEEFNDQIIEANNLFIKRFMKNMKFTVMSELFISGLSLGVKYLIIFLMGYFVLFVYKGSPEVIGIIAAVPIILDFLISGIRYIGIYISNYKSAKELAQNYETLIAKARTTSTTKPSYEFNSLEIRNLNFSYEDEKPFFKNLNLSFEKGKKYALIGPSGSGKSTLLNLITKQLENYQGEIILNGINIKNIEDSDYKNTFTFLDSEEFVFNDTIYNNISLWTPDQEDKAEKALNLASYSVEDLNLKLNNENSNISSGQKQRINFARFFFDEKNLLILDEALANLDKNNVAKIEQNLFNNSELTLINVTHHLKNPEKYHRIYKMEELTWK